MPEDQRLGGGFFGDEEPDDQQLASEPTDPGVGDFFGSRDSGSAGGDDFFGGSERSNRAGSAVRTAPPVQQPSQAVSSPTKPPPPVGDPRSDTSRGNRKPVNKLDQQAPKPGSQPGKRPAPPVFEPKQASPVPASPPPTTGPPQQPRTRRPAGPPGPPLGTPQQPPPGAPSNDWFESPNPAPAAPTSPAPTRRAPSGPSIPDPYAVIDEVEPTDRKGRQAAKRRRQAQLREERWARTRLAVPYHTDGPKMTFALVWFVAVFSSLLISPILTALVTSVVASVAAMQAAQAWFGTSPARWWTATAGAVVAFSGYFGALGLVGGLLIACGVLGIYIMAGDGHHRSSGELFDVLARSSLPAGLAAGGIVAVTQAEPLAAIGLVLLISAYEAGDYLVGSGSRTAAEGPIAGFISLSVMAFVLAMVVPDPYTVTTVVAFAAIAAISALAGQIFASASLPRGVAWAPALRRLDSYIITAPIWLLLVFLLVPS